MLKPCYCTAQCAVHTDINFTWTFQSMILSQRPELFRGPSRARLLVGDPSALLTSPFAPFGRLCCVTHAGNQSSEMMMCYWSDKFLAVYIGIICIIINPICSWEASRCSTFFASRLRGLTISLHNYHNHHHVALGRLRGVPPSLRRKI